MAIDCDPKCQFILTTWIDSFISFTPLNILMQYSWHSPWDCCLTNTEVKINSSYIKACNFSIKALSSVWLCWCLTVCFFFIFYFFIYSLKFPLTLSWLMPIYSVLSTRVDCTSPAVSIAVISTPISFRVSLCVCIMCLECSVIQSLYNNSQAVPRALLLSLILILLDWNAEASLNSVASVAFCHRTSQTGRDIRTPVKQDYSV